MFNIILLGLTSLFTDISSEMVYPLVPLYLVTRLGASPAIVGLIEGLAESLASLLKVFSGYFSDKWKSRKPLTIAGYSCSAAGKFALFAATSWGCVLFGRLIDRFGKGVRTAPRDALIADSVHDGKRGAAFGLHRAMDTIGACIGISAAYLLLQRHNGDFKNVFMLSLIPAIIGVVILLLVKEKKKNEQKAPSKSPVKFEWRSLDKRLKLFLIVSFVFTLGNSSNQFLLLRAQNVGNPLPVVILLYLVYNVVYALSAYPAARLSDVVGRRALLVLGYAFYGVVYLGFALAHSPVHMWILFAVYGLYSGFTEGVEKAFISDSAPGPVRATAIGLHATLVGIGLFPASLLAGILWRYWGPQAPFYFGGFMGLGASIGLWFALRER